MSDPSKRLGELDLCFMVDETGSMGPYINTVKQKILEIIHNIRSKELCSSLRIALVGYRDHPPEDTTFVTRVSRFNENAEEIKEAVLRMAAAGGGDGPEAVTDALYDINRLTWREKAAKIVIWMGDAPPHGVEGSGDNFKKGCPDGKDWKKEAQYAYDRGILIYPVGCYPEINNYKKAVKVYREIGSITKGKFIPLEKAHLLVSLITGVAESELEKLKIEEIVLQEMQEVMAEAPAASPKEIEERVYSRLKKRDVSLKSLAAAKFEAGAPVEEEDLKVEKRKVEKDDIKEAMRQVKLKKLMKD
ncbi:MAG: VWA domain-containing protein [Candidatus Hodarchaeota archaeon]